MRAARLLPRFPAKVARAGSGGGKIETGLDRRELVRRGLWEAPLAILALLLLGTGAGIMPPDALIGAGVVQLNLERLLVLAAFGALLAVELGRRRRYAALEGGSTPPRRAWRRLTPTGLELPLALLLLAALVATIEWGTEARFRFLAEGVAVFYLAFAVVRTRPEARGTLAVVALVAVSLAALTGIAQVSQEDATGFYRVDCVPVTRPAAPPPADSITRATGTFSNPNVLAGFLLLLAPMAALAAGPLRDAARGRLAVGLLVALAYLALALTYSRAAVLFALAALGAGALASSLRHRAYVAAAGVAIAVGASLLFAGCGSDATAGYGRAEEWRETIEVARDHPVRGVGLGRLGDILRERTGIGTVRHAHNLLLTWWAEAGTGALIAWLALLVVLLRRSFRAARAGDAAARAAFVALAGFTGFSMLDHPANVDRVALAFWIVAGIAAACGPAAARGGGSGSPPDEPDPAAVPRPPAPAAAPDALGHGGR